MRAVGHAMAQDLDKLRARLKNTIQLVHWARQVASDTRAREQRAWQRALRAAARVERLMLGTTRHKAELQIIQQSSLK